MTAFSQQSLQTAIYQALAGDSNLMTMVTGVYDRPPQTTYFPYITIGESQASDWSTKTTAGTAQKVSLHIWSREGGGKETADIMEAVYGVLHQASLTVTGHSLTLLHFLSSEMEMERDGVTYHGSMTFKALLQAS